MQFLRPRKDVSDLDIPKLITESRVEFKYTPGMGTTY
jgi:hypothetical protein